MRQDALRTWVKKESPHGFPNGHEEHVAPEQRGRRGHGVEQTCSPHGFSNGHGEHVAPSEGGAEDMW